MKKVIVFVCVCMFLCISTAFANKELALETLQKNANELLAILSDPAFKDPATKAEMRQKAEDTVMDLLDFEEFSQRTVGANWKSFTPEEKTQFIAAFTKLLRNTYITYLDEYQGESVKYKSVIDGDNGTRVEIQTGIISQNKEYPVAFRMLEKNNKWVVYDVLFENISLIKNYRDQFGDLLTKSSPEELIKKLEEKAIEAQNTKKP